MKAHIHKNETEKFNLILAYDPKANEDGAMLTVGRINHAEGQVRVLTNFKGEEATKLYKKLIGEDKDAV